MIILRFPFGFNMEGHQINGKDRYGFILIYKLADVETDSFKLSITQPTAPSGSDIGPEAFVIPTGCQRKQHFLSFSTCYLCSQKAHGREGGVWRMPRQQPVHTTAKSNRTGRSNFSPLSLGIAPFSQDIFHAPQ